MVTIIVRHTVGNIDAWKMGHQDRVALFAPAVSGFKTFQDAENPKAVVMVIEVTDLVKLVGIMNDPRNDEIKKLHTVIEPIIISMPLEL